MCVELLTCVKEDVQLFRANVHWSHIVKKARVSLEIGEAVEGVGG